MPVVNYTGSVDLDKAIVLYNNLALTAVITDANLPASTPRVNVIDPATYSHFSGVTNAFITMDMLSAVTVDTVGVSAHNMATSGSSVVIQYSSDGVSWADARPSYSPLTDDDLIFTFGDITARYWRFNFTNPSIMAVGVIFIGKRLAFPHTPIDSYTPLHHARKYTKFFNDSIRGQFLANRVMAAGAETEVNLGFVQRSFVDGPLRAFESHYNQGGLFFYAGWPAGQPLDMGYCRAASQDGSVAVEYIEGENLANLSFSVVSYVG